MAEDGAIEIRVVFGGSRGGYCVRRRKRRNIDGSNPLAFALQSCAVNHAFKFADVARPIVCVQTGQRVRSEAANRLIVDRGEASRKIIGEEGQIVSAVP